VVRDLTVAGYLQVEEARVQLQRAIDACHFAPTAKYLRQTAAACLKHGLQPASLGQGPNIRFEMKPVTFPQVAEHVRAASPDIEHIFDRLQGKTASKYFVMTNEQPVRVIMRVHDLIQPPYQRAARDLLDSIKECSVSAQQLSSGSRPPAVRVIPLYTTNTNSGASVQRVEQEDDHVSLI